jgi:hypothetical protein
VSGGNNVPVWRVADPRCSVPLLEKRWKLPMPAEFDVPELERSMALIEKVFREQGPFDGIVGFSQVGGRRIGTQLT